MRCTTSHGEAFLIRGLSVLWALTLIVWAESAAAHASQPNPETVSYLQQLFSKGQNARVHGFEGERVVAGPRFTAEGMRDVDSTGVVKLTSWSEIERIDARGASPMRGAVVGGIVGAGAGVGLGFVAALANEGSGGVQDFVGIVALSSLAGALVGAVIGSTFPGWHEVYPSGKRYPSGWGLEKK